MDDDKQDLDVVPPSGLVPVVHHDICQLTVTFRSSIPVNIAKIFKQVTQIIFCKYSNINSNSF